MIRLIALDLDDTLLMPDCTIPSDVISVLQRADSQYGVRIVIATGRIYPSAKIYAEQLGTKSHIICYNGAMIREIGKEPLYTAELDPDLIRRIAVFCRERDLYLVLLVLLNNLVKKCLEALKFQGAWRFENGYFLKMGIANRPDP